MPKLPNRLTVAGKEAKHLQWLNDLRDCVEAIWPRPTVDSFNTVTTRGAFRRPKVTASTSADPGELVQLKVKTVGDEYLTCHTWDGTTEGTDNVYVAKPRKLRKSNYHLITQTIYGKAFKFTHVSAQERTCRVSSKDWTQYVHPTYAVDDVIYAAPIEHEDGTTLAQLLGIPTSSGFPEISYIDVNNDAREWATVLTVCDNSVTKLFVCPGLPPYNPSAS